MTTNSSHEDLTTPATASTPPQAEPTWGTAPAGGTVPGPGGHEGPRAGGPVQPGPGAGFFSAVRRLGIVRSDRGRVVAGVCGGLARRWGMNPLLVRLAFVLLGLVFGAGLFVYGVLWLLLPHPDGRIHVEQALRGVFTAGFFGGLVAVLAGWPFDGFGAHDHGGAWVPVLVVAVIVWWLASRNRDRSFRI